MHIALKSRQKILDNQKFNELFGTIKFNIGLEGEPSINSLVTHDELVYHRNKNDSDQEKNANMLADDTATVDTRMMDVD